MSPVSASTVNRSTLEPSSRYRTTALGPTSRSSARTGPFKTSTELPEGETGERGERGERGETGETDETDETDETGETGEAVSV